MQMYVQLAQHQQAADQFNKGLGLLAASAYPGRRPDIIMNAMGGGGGADPASLFGNMMTMQNWQQQQQRYQSMMGSIPAMAQKMGIDPSILTTMLQSDPEGFGKSIGQIEMAQAGLTGNLTDKEYRGAVKNFQAANPDQPLPPELQTEAAFAQQQSENITTRNATAKDLVADKANFQPALQNYDKALGAIMDQLQTPAMQEGSEGISRHDRLDAAGGDDVDERQRRPGRSTSKSWRRSSPPAPRTSRARAASPSRN